MTQRQMVFYDGDCGFCHGAVRFILPRDEFGIFGFAPIDSDAFRRQTQGLAAGGLPDSIIVAKDGQLFFESDAAVAVMRRLTGPWPALAGVIQLIPKPIRDAAYRLIARNRKRFFKKPDGVCPLVPPQYKSRFELS